MIHTMCLAYGAPLSINYESTLVRRAIRPPKSSHRWEVLGAVHEECEKLVTLEEDRWNVKRTTDTGNRG